MSLNHSTYTNQLTFQDLDEMTEQLYQKMQEYLRTCYLQAGEINRWTLRTSDVTEKLQVLNRKLEILKCLQNDTTKCLKFITNEQRYLEETLQKVERDIYREAGENDVADGYRQKTYETAEEIHRSFLNLKQLLNEFDFQVNQIEISKIGDVSQFDLFAQVLQAHLQQLEIIEMKIIQMTGELSHIELVNRSLSPV